MKKKIKYIGIVLVILFCCYNLFWYFGSYKPYNEFQKDFPEIEESGVKIYTDKDGFQYSVSVPDYLLWNGNLAIAESDVRYALIIMSRMEMVLFRVQMLVKVIGLKLRLLIKEIVLPTVIATKQRFGIMAEWLEFQPLFFVECI